MSLFKNISGQVQYLQAYDTAASPVAGKTGDAGNITGYYSIDGGAATVFATANPTELSASNMKGVYKQPLAQAETNGNRLAFSWASSTSGIVIDPVFVDTTIKPRVVKNTALAAFEFPMYDSSNINDLKTGLSPTVHLSIDGATFVAATNAASEVNDVGAVPSGVYKLDLAAADLNGDVITFKATATGALDTLIEIVTQV